MDWQPIATAPKETNILVCKAGWPGSVWIVCDKGKQKRIWYRGKFSRSRMHMDATHWMPVPVPPTADTRAAATTGTPATG
jgi:hypothetical protein